jgi:hypothetical protein
MAENVVGGTPLGIATNSFDRTDDHLAPMVSWSGAERIGCRSATPAVKMSSERSGGFSTWRQ